MAKSKINMATDAMNILNNYSDDVTKLTQKIQWQTGQKAKKEIKAVSDVETDSEWHGFKMRSPHGQFQKGWGLTRQDKGTPYETVVVRNKTDWGLTHLLAKGHALKVGGRSVGKKVPAGSSKGIYAIKDNYEGVNGVFIQALKSELKTL